MGEIESIFKMRDNAVVSKDQKLFASTQLQDIPNASIGGYLAAGKLETEVLHVVEDTKITKMAFVKENYGTHSAFLLYYFVNTVDGWKIYNIVSS